MMGVNKLLAFIFLSVFFCSFASATVNEYNYFKLGELDSANNLVPGFAPVSGVGIRSFVCFDAACSGSLGDLWGGSLYASGSALNLVYPTSLMSSSGYGFWVYKTGYNPYWVKGVTWYGTGTVPAVNRYLTRKSNCFSDVSINSPSQVGSTLSFSTGVTSPFVNQYGSMYVPSEIAPHLKTLVDVVVEVENSAGVVVWSNSGQRSLDYSSSGSVSFSATLPDGSYVLNAYSRLGNEAKCSSYTQDVASLSFDVDTCTESVVYGPWSAWSNSESCQTNNFLTQSRSRLEYDQNGCGDFTPVTHWDYQEAACDYCTPSIVTSPWSAWFNTEVCQSNDFLTQERTSIRYDSNACYSITGLVSDIFVNVTYTENQEKVCDYCTESVVYGPWSAWSNSESCQADGFLTQSRSRVEYDQNNCGNFVSVTHWDYQEVACDLFPLVVDVIANPNFGAAPLDVSFSCVAQGGNGVLEYSWNFDNGDVDVGSNVFYIYDEVGEYNVRCKVEDEDGDEAFGYVSVDVGLSEFEDVNLVCFDEVVVGHNQSCSVSIGGGLGDVDVDIFYSDGSLFGSCLTDDISGACGVKDLQSVVGSFDVYATASKVGYVDDNSSVFGYDVLDENYSIVYLKVFNDSGFSYEDYDFFRGEDLFVSFVIEDLNGDVVLADLISRVSLVSSVAGGRVDLEEIEMINGSYYYRLIPVPITHDFILLNTPWLAVGMKPWQNS